MPDLLLRDLVASPSEGVSSGPINASVEPGRLLAVLGIDPASLTAMARTVARGEGMAGGTVLLDDETLFPGRQRRPRVALLPSALPAASRNTVERHLEHTLKEQGVDRTAWAERIAGALDVAELGRHAQRRLYDLTESVLLRCALAAAIVWQPPALICDQPLARLPAHLRADLRQLLGTLARRCEMPVILFTTDTQEALSLSTELALLHGGRIVQQGPPLLLYKRPLNRSIADILGEGNYLPATLLRCAAGFAMVDTPAGHFRAALPEDFEPTPGRELTVLIRPEALHIERMPADENTLSGRVVQVEYFGAAARYRFQAGPTAFTIRELNPRFATPPPNELYAWVDAEDVVVLPG